MIDHGRDLVTETHCAHWRTRNIMARGRQYLQSAIRGRQCYMVHLSKVVIVGGQPEHRHSVDSRARCFFREFHCGQSLVDGKHRAAEKPHLLARNHSSRSLAQAIEVRERLFRRTPGSVLFVENRGDPFPSQFVIRDAASFLFQPFSGLWGPGIEPLDLRGISEEVEEKTRGMRDLRERETLRLHRQHSWQHVAENALIGFWTYKFVVGEIISSLF